MLASEGIFGNGYRFAFKDFFWGGGGGVGKFPPIIKRQYNNEIRVSRPLFMMKRTRVKRKYSRVGLIHLRRVLGIYSPMLKWLNNVRF